MWKANGLTVDSCFYYLATGQVEIRFNWATGASRWEAWPELPYLVVAWNTDPLSRRFELPYLDENLVSGSYKRIYTGRIPFCSLMFFKRDPTEHFTSLFLEIKMEEMVLRRGTAPALTPVERAEAVDQAARAGDLAKVVKEAQEVIEAAKQVEQVAPDVKTQTTAYTVEAKAIETQQAALVGDVTTTQVKASELRKAASALAAPKWGLAAIVIGLLLLAAKKKK